MALLRVSLLKLVRRPATWIVFAILAGLIALVFLSLGATAGNMESMMDEMVGVVGTLPKRMFSRARSGQE